MINDIILKFLQMAENDKMNFVIIRSTPSWWTMISERLPQKLILSLRIFVTENPSSSIKRLYLDSEILRQEISDVTSVKVFKERHVTVVLNATYDEMDYMCLSHHTYIGRPANKMNSVHVICGVTDVGQRRGKLHKYVEDMMQHHNLFLSQPLQTEKEGMMHYQKGFTSGEIFIFQHYLSNTMLLFFGTPTLDRQDMDMFFYKCIQKADGSGVTSVTFLVPNIVRSIKLFASTLISCVKRFAENTPSSNVKRIYIRIDKCNPQFQETKQVFEEEWVKTSGGKQGYPSEDIYLEKKLSISKLPEKSKEGFTYVPQEDVD